MSDPPSINPFSSFCLWVVALCDPRALIPPGNPRQLRQRRGHATLWRGIIPHSHGPRRQRPIQRAHPGDDATHRFVAPHQLALLDRTVRRVFGALTVRTGPLPYLQVGNQTHRTTLRPQFHSRSQCRNGAMVRSAKNHAVHRVLGGQVCRLETSRRRQRPTVPGSLSACQSGARAARGRRGPRSPPLSRRRWRRCAVRP